MSVSNGPKLHKMINAVTGDTFAIDFRSFLRMVESLVQCAVVSRTVSAPPGSPADGDTYIVGPAPTGVWAGIAGRIVVWTMNDPASPSGVWENYIPNAGFLVFSVAESQFLEWSGSAWVPAIAGGLPVYTVANLPASPPVGSVAYASNGRKVGEGAGLGTGVPGYFSAGAWKRYSDDTTVAA
jgi:hypothetical protein